MKYCLAILLVLISCYSFSQKLPSVKILQDSIKSSFRGLSVPSDNIVWVSGSNGRVGRSTDAGKTWKWMIVTGFEKRDFRDIEAFDSLIAIIMAVDNPADILKTTDGGKNWKVVFHKEQEGMFLDAMDFKGAEGVCIGDPLLQSNGEKAICYLHTSNYGDSWIEFHSAPTTINNEAIFAGSGTNVSVIASHEVESAFITGGIYSRLLLFHNTRNRYYEYELSILKGKTSTGAFSLYSDGKKEFYITGGDYVEYWKDSGNVVYTTNRGYTWKRSSVHGYRSCIIQADKKTFLTCGTNGVDISFDGCKTWKLIHGDGAKGTDGFNVCAKSKTGKAVYFAGSGRIGKLIP